jgi:hypothetical protein
MYRMRRLCFILALTIAAAGCSKSPFELAASELSEARSRWASAGVRDYTYRVQRVCFCPGVPTLAVTVRNGAFVSATDFQTGAPADTAGYGDYLTIDKIFALLDRYVAQKPAKFEGSYDAALGFPIRVEIDPVFNAVDEELTINVSAFVRN